MEKMTVERCRDRLLRSSTSCHSAYKKRKDRCKYCEVAFFVGLMCPQKEKSWRDEVNEKYPHFLLDNDNDSLDVFTIASMCNREKYFAYFGEDVVMDEWEKDKALCQIRGGLKSNKKPPQK